MTSCLQVLILVVNVTKVRATLFPAADAVAKVSLALNTQEVVTVGNIGIVS